MIGPDYTSAGTAGGPPEPYRPTGGSVRLRLLEPFSRSFQGNRMANRSVCALQ